MSFNVPCMPEGFDEIKIIYPENIKFTSISTLINKYYKISHDNPHHTASIGEHMNNAAMLLTTKYMPEVSLKDMWTLYMATILHDIGKPFTKTFINSKGEETSMAHYYNHNNVGAYGVFFTAVPEEIKIDVALLIQYHMNYYMSWKQSRKAENKDREFLSKRLSDMLDILHVCDLEAH